MLEEICYVILPNLGDKFLLSKTIKIGKAMVRDTITKLVEIYR